MKSLNPERVNFLQHCWATGRLSDAARLLAQPARKKAYAVKKRLQKKFGRVGKAAAVTHGSKQDALVFSSDVRSVFAASIIPKGSTVAADPWTLAQASEQLSGTFRLAGGVPRTGNPEQCVDKEDQHSYHRLYWAVRYARAGAAGEMAAIFF